MSTAAITKAIASRWPVLKRILIAIGKWILGVARRRGVPILVGYMLERVEVFKGRLGRAKTTRRKRWLRGRIRRWTKAARWLTTNARAMHTQALAKFEELAARLPERSPMERQAA